MTRFVQIAAPSDDEEELKKVQKRVKDMAKGCTAKPMKLKRKNQNGREYTIWLCQQRRFGDKNEEKRWWDSIKDIAIRR